MALLKLSALKRRAKSSAAASSPLNLARVLAEQTKTHTHTRFDLRLPEASTKCQVGGKSYKLHWAPVAQPQYAFKVWAQLCKPTPPAKLLRAARAVLSRRRDSRAWRAGPPHKTSRAAWTTARCTRCRRRGGAPQPRGCRCMRYFRTRPVWLRQPRPLRSSGVSGKSPLAKQAKRPSCH